MTTKDITARLNKLSKTETPIIDEYGDEVYPVRDEFMSLLQKTFPDAWFKPSEDFDGYLAGIWSGEGSYVSDGEEMFKYYADGGDYEMGVHKELVNILDQHGWWAECQDGGTYMIWNGN